MKRDEKRKMHNGMNKVVVKACVDWEFKKGYMTWRDKVNSTTSCRDHTRGSSGLMWWGGD